MFAATEKPPGVAINHLAATQRSYLGSPSIAVLPDNSYVVSHDNFGKDSTEDKTLIFQSGDKGATWNQIAKLQGQW